MSGTPWAGEIHDVFTSLAEAAAEYEKSRTDWPNCTDYAAERLVTAWVEFARLVKETA